MRTVKKTPLHIKIGGKISGLIPLDATKIPGDYNDLFAKEAHKNRIFREQNAEQYDFLFRKTRRDLQRQLSKRKNEKSNRHAGHSHTDDPTLNELHDLQYLARKTLRRNGRYWTPPLEQSYSDD